MARLLIVEPEADFHALFDAALAQAGYVAVEAANSYEGRRRREAVCLASVTGSAGARTAPCSWSKRQPSSTPFSVTSWPRRATDDCGGPQRCGRRGGRQEGHPVSGRLLTGPRLAVRRSHRKRHDEQGLGEDTHLYAGQTPTMKEAAETVNRPNNDHGDCGFSTAQPHRHYRALPAGYPLGVPPSKVFCDGVEVAGLGRCSCGALRNARRLPWRTAQPHPGSP